MKIYPLILSLTAAIFITACGGGGGDSNSDIQYVALGASDATGIGAQPLTNGYVYLIEDRLKERGASVNLHNFGIPGAEIGDIQDITVSETIRENPDLITISTGANDLIDGDSVINFEEDLRNVVRDLYEETDAFIVIANIPNLMQIDRFSDGSDADVTSDRLQQYNQAIANVAGTYGIPVVNLQAFNAGQYTADDGFHPNDGGHRIIADAFLTVIEPQFFSGN